MVVVAELENRDALEPWDLGQRCLREGNAAGAIRHFEEALRRPGGDTVDARLVLAEALWQQAGPKGTDRALPHYEAAAALAASAGDASKEAMVALGHGFALTQLGRGTEAVKQLERARELAKGDGNVGAVQFVERLLEQASADSPPPAADDPEVTHATWKHFAESLATDQSALLFLRGKLVAPLDDASRRGATRLRAAGCVSLRVVDVCDAGNDIPEGLQAVSNSSHLEFPQLYVAGIKLRGWLEMPVEQLRRELSEAGVELGEPREEPCHGTAAFSEGLEPWEVALVEVVSQIGSGRWSEAADKVRAKEVGGPEGSVTAATMEAAWKRLAPLVKDKLERQPDMPCGHTCSTCPTSHDCQLHDAVDKVRDIEDLVG